MEQQKLKYHETRLLKKTNFLTYDEKEVKDNQAILHYKLRDQKELASYQSLLKSIGNMNTLLTGLDKSDKLRIRLTDSLLDKLYEMGIIDDKSSLSQVKRIPPSKILRRRLSAMLVRMKMAESIDEASRLIRKGNVRVGPQIVTDPAFLVTRIRTTISMIDQRLDDYELMG
ncbi:hypothetical protein PROFUN_09397 [Planoprotostelium fungivorum]|uniref:Uncharacterized protein n=1 Tax=Planoprotostelium fungivorum TaxID=1890364 RepID=A0A2P6NHE0_9EUKA|nr:hypothetical protein PROFUN_09397 [Planoprotostelium fungivorum]